MGSWRTTSAGIAALLALGCAPGVFGQAQSITCKGEFVYKANGDTTCTKGYKERNGGQISSEGAALLGQAIQMGKKMGAASAGVPPGVVDGEEGP